MTMISENEHKMTYMYNYHINHTITEHTSSNLHVHTIACLSATCLHAWIQEISPGGGSRPNTFQGVLTLSRGWGGVQLLFSIETCGFSRVGGPDLLPHPSGSTHDLYMQVSLCKTFKSHKNVAGSKFSKGAGFHGHLKILCRQNQFYCIRS